MDTQCAEFDALEEVVKAWRSQPAIVDDDYPEWRFGFERHLQTFFEKCADNGRFSNTSIVFGGILASLRVKVIDELTLGQRQLHLRAAIEALASSREKSLALTKLDECEMWLEKLK